MMKKLVASLAVATLVVAQPLAAATRSSESLPSHGVQTTWLELRQHGLVRLDVTIVACMLIAAGLGLGAIWMQLGAPVRRRVTSSAAVLAVASAAALAGSLLTASWDTSEARSNSFPEADEEGLARIRGPLRIEAHLAPEDPRRADLERRALSKLRRVMPGLQVRYVSATSIGIFEQTADHYGEIWYELDGRKTMSRVTTAEGVLESIYEVAGVTPPAEGEEEIFRGHPLAVPPRGAAAVFYGVWPAATAAVALFIRRRAQ